MTARQTRIAAGQTRMITRIAPLLFTAIFAISAMANGNGIAPVSSGGRTQGAAPATSLSCGRVLKPAPTLSDNPARQSSQSVGAGFIPACQSSQSAGADSRVRPQDADTTRVIDIEEVEIISTPKESGKLRRQPAAVSLLGQQDMERLQVRSLKGLSMAVPNLFVPDYGSRLTSAIYIRGIGSRINSPAVALYVDNVPYFDKSAFDFPFYDIERIDVLRGPQGTLYGRNSMGGIISIHTRSPFSYQGTDVKFGLSTKDLRRHASVTHYHRISSKFAFSAGGYYDGSSGFFRNAYSGQRQDRMESGGGRLRGILKPLSGLKIDLSLGYDYTHEGGYPYYYLGQLSGQETHADWIGHISNNQKSSYRRGMLNGGLNVEYATPKFTMNAVTGFQHLEDRMFMDQDFLPDSLYTLLQKQKLTILSEEITMKSNGRRTWQWVNGVAVAKQWLRTTGPVEFGPDGVKMLENTINSYMPDLSGRGISNMGVSLSDPSFTTGGTFQTPVFNAAAFHQSTLRFCKSLSATLGLRLDYEHNSLYYNAPAELDYAFSMQSGRMPLNLNGLEASQIYKGHIQDDHLELLPKLALQYEAGRNISVYASVAKGHRSGGYNVQMFSDLLQSGLQGAMMQGIKDGVNATLERYAAMGMPQSVISLIQSGLDQMPVPQQTDVRRTVKYKPEYSWTYELGTKLSFFDNALRVDADVFLSTVRDQQIARFSPNGLGRMMANAGRSRNWGVEASVNARPARSLLLFANYGYTYAIFTRYDAGNGADYTHKRVPFIPRHILSAGADWQVFENRGLSESSSSKFWHSASYGKDYQNGAGRSASTGKQSAVFSLNSITLGASLSGAGRIYWTESNDASQSLYTTLSAHARMDFRHFSINLWGANLLNKHYHSFYFQSMRRAFAQKGRPLQLGLDVNVKL